jgi:hypothetical protein
VAGGAKDGRGTPVNVKFVTAGKSTLLKRASFPGIPLKLAFPSEISYFRLSCVFVFSLIYKVKYFPGFPGKWQLNFRFPGKP